MMIVSVAVLAQGAERVIFEKPSAFGQLVVTEDDHKLRTLRFGRFGARQSVVKMGDPEHLELPYARVAFSGLALSGDARRFLVVGLGGGTLPMFLRKFYPQAVIDVVDIDPEVVAVAKQYFGFIEDSQMRAHVADGRLFIEKTKEPYDAIFLDAFGSESVPAHLTTQEFLQAVRKALAPGGVVIGNVWGRYSNALYDAMVRTYQEVFDEIYVLGVRGSGNVILLALPRMASLTRDEFASLARRVSASRNMRFDLGDVSNFEFQRSRDKDTSTRILRDPGVGAR